MLDLPAAWRLKAEGLRPYAPAAAAAFEESAAGLCAALAAEAGDLLSLRDAADVSGYSADHLARLVRAGKLNNYGERHRPRLRRGDLPRKPAAIAASRPKAYSASADARELLAVRRGAS